MQQRTGYSNPPPAMNTSGGTMIQRPPNAAYAQMRTQMQTPPGAKRPADTRTVMQQKR